MTGRRRLFVRYSVSALVAGFAAYTLWRLVDWSVVLRTLRTVSLPVYLLAVPAYYLTVPVRTARWRLLLDESGVDSDWRSATTVVFLSLFLNTVLPAKGGDLYRAHVGGRLYDAMRSVVLGTVTVERTLDLTVLLAGVMVAVTGLSSVTLSGGRRLLVLSGVALAVLGALTGVVLIGPHLGLPAPFDEYIAEFHAGFTSVSSISTFASVVGLTAVLWGLNVARIWVIVTAIQLELGLFSILLVALVISVLTGLPYTPAGVGVVEVAGTTLLLALGTSGGTGFSVVVLDRLVSVGSVVLIGGVVYAVGPERYRPVTATESDPPV